MSIDNDNERCNESRTVRITVATDAHPIASWLPEHWVTHCQGKGEDQLTWADDLVQQIWRPVLFGLCVGLPLAYIVRTRVIGTRYPTAGHISPEAFAKREVIKGRVVSVGDSDNFRLYHTPGFGWGWLRKVPNKQKELKDQTIAVRLAGIDAPEGAHFGMPAQAMSAEALAFLKSLILHRTVKVQLLSRDQYNRAVAMAFVRKPPFYRRKNVSVEMCRAGMASIYTAKGYQYGDCLKELEKAQARAKLLKKGIWGLTDYVSPGSHKAKHLRGGSP